MASLAVSDLPDFDGDIRTALIPIVDLAETDVALRNRSITGAELLRALTGPKPSSVFSTGLWKDKGLWRDKDLWKD